jgi:hypothetical protein
MPDDRMITRNISLEMLVTRAPSTDDQKLLALMVKRVGVCAADP